VNSACAYCPLGSDGNAGLQNAVNGNHAGVANPGLAPLADYGGPTLTVARLPGSPALGAGSKLDHQASLSTDQRGFARFHGGAIDSGAFEAPLVTFTEDAHMLLPFSHKLLVVEDDPDTRYGLLLVLAGAGYEADAVANGQEALDYLHAVRELPRLILLDLKMPVMDGWQFLRARAGDSAMVGISVLIVTAEPATNPAALGAVGIVVKPVNEATLLDGICRHARGLPSTHHLQLPSSTSSGLGSCNGERARP
jgi:CheY-like chemotaxis protein